MDRSEAEQKIADRLYDALRDDLLKRDLSNTENYDKAILTLSSSSLAFSLAAIKYIVPVNTSDHVWLLESGWGLLSLSVIFSLAAYLVGNKAIAVQLANARAYYKEGIEDAFNRTNRPSKINSFLNHATGILLSVAIVAVVIFVGINLKAGETDMSNKTPKTTISKSANIPSLESVGQKPGGSTTISNPEKLAINSANIPTMEQAPGTGSTSKGGSSSGDKK